jgi:hypothetical protein
MPRHTFHLDLPRELSEREQAIFERSLRAIWETVRTRADRHDELAPHTRHLKKRIPNLGDLHQLNDGHRHEAGDHELGQALYPDDHPDKVAQLECGDCHRTLLAANVSGQDPAFLVCPQVFDHPDLAGACHAGCVVDCGERFDELGRPIARKERA